MSLVKWTFIGLLDASRGGDCRPSSLVAASIGWLWAAILFIATSVTGVLLLRRSGRARPRSAAGAFARDGLRAVHLETPGVGTMLGGILLSFPGFITDLVGGALFVPAFRRWASRAQNSQRGRDAARRHAIPATIMSSISSPANGTKFRIRPAQTRDIVTAEGWAKLQCVTALSGSRPCVSHAADCGRFAQR